MRYVQLLEAVNIDQLTNEFGQKLLAKDDHSKKSQDPNKLINLFVDADPTTNKNYTKWMIRTYITGGIRHLEDLSRTQKALALFDKFKSKLPADQRDIGKIKKLSDLENLVEQFAEAKTGKQEKAEEKAKLYKEIETFYSGPEGKILIPKTEEASCFLGRGTKWCTAATESENYFDYYNTSGSLYIILTSDGSKFQFHFENGEFTDASDESFDLVKFDKKYPWVFRIFFDKLGEENLVVKMPQLFQFVKNPSEQVQLAAVNRDSDAIAYIKNPSEQVQIAAVNRDGYAIQYIKKPSEQVQIAAVKQTGFAIQFIDNTSQQVQIVAVKQTGFAIRFIDNTSEQVQLAAVNQDGNAIQYIKKPIEQVQIAAVKQNGFAIRFIEIPSKQVQLAAVKQTGFAIKYIKNPSEQVKLVAKIGE
jgi:hypothetical protein